MSVPVFLTSFQLTLYKTDIILRQTLGAGPKDFRLGESWQDLHFALAETKIWRKKKDLGRLSFPGLTQWRMCLTFSLNGSRSSNLFGTRRFPLSPTLVILPTQISHQELTFAVRTIESVPTLALVAFSWNCHAQTSIFTGIGYTRIDCKKHVMN